MRSYIWTSDEKFDIAPWLSKNCNNAYVTSVDAVSRVL